MTTNILRKDIILQHTTSENIYLKFLNLTEFPKGNISSPFSEDKNASFKLYKNGSFKCFTSGKQGKDVFQFVAYLNNLDNKAQFNEVLKIVAMEMNLPLQHLGNGIATNVATNIAGYKKDVSASKTITLANSSQALEEPLQHSRNDIATFVATEKTPSKLTVSVREFKELDLAYWKNLGVEIAVLDTYKVKSISNYNWPDKKPIYTKNETVAFAYELEGIYKVYVPEQTVFGIKKNVIPHIPDSVFGLEQLGTEKKAIIIICEGEKDTIIATSRGFNAVTFGACNIRPKKEIIKILQSKCNQLFICYDTDDSGINGMNEIVKNHPEITPIYLSKNEAIKGYDLTDYFQEHTAQDFQKIIDLAVKNKAEVQPKKYSEYQFPDEIKEPIEKYIKDIEKYRMFMADNQIWIMQGDIKKNFKCVSNFVVKIIQHMQDEKFPMKLIKIRNVYKQEKIFDVLSDKLNTPQKFDDIVTSHGNYLWSGTPKDFHTLKTYLFDKMGNGKKIDCLGWQKEGGFWIWNNKVNLCDGNQIEIDENGIFKHKNISYYVPSANKVYKENAFKYETQKRVCIKIANVPIETYLSKMFEVHGINSISAMLFTISSIFQDIIEEEIKGFPILFLHGETSSGKDQLANCCQSFFGKPQSAINVEGGVSTAKAHIRELAQFSNIISQFSEYKNGDKQLDGMLKGIWDRNGYKRGTLESNSSTETIPILSSLILTGNHSPDDKALISRLLWIDMSKNVFTDEERQKYNELHDMTEKGISSFTNDLLQYRSVFKDSFKSKFRLYKTSIEAQMPPSSPSRISTNFGVLGATYEIFKDFIIFPFSYKELIRHFVKISEVQMNKFNSASVTNKWWDSFLACIKSNGDNKLEFDRDIKVEGDNLYFNFSNTYTKIQRQWHNQYKESIPSKMTMQESLKKESFFVEVKSSYRFRTGKDGSNTSAYVVAFKKLSIYEEINEQIVFTNTLP
ncbi:MAG: toprim domain-containing protein [Flavobacterium circumlabens]|uniref:toprim domain-containing protein n=1 Tax=Flavobacterium circumlabens TaxID=2133765 RepID=UPI0032673439